MIGFHFLTTPKIGTGHARRCSVLAHALSEAGLDITIFSDEPTIKFSRLHFPDTCHFYKIRPDPESLLSALEGKTIDSLVVDLYELDCKIEQKLRSKVRSLVILDDFVGRQHDCDILVDQNPGRIVSDWIELQAKGTIVLAGAGYALLRNEFYSMRKSSLRQVGENRKRPRIFICFGGVDIKNLTLRSCRAIFSAFGDTLEYDIAIGSGSLHLDKLISLVEAVPSARLHVDSQDVADLMAGATVSVGAPGSMTLERCCLRLPSILVSFVDNQVEIGRMAEDMRIASYLGDYDGTAPHRISLALGDLMNNPEKLQIMSERAGRITDGLGAGRVAAAILPEQDRHGVDIRLRFMREDDIEQIFSWQDSEGLRKFSNNSESISWADHQKWSQGRLLNFPMETYIACDGNMIPVGLLHLAPMAVGGFLISLLVAPQSQGRGIATAMLKSLEKIYSRVPLYAVINKENIASIKAFLATGFVSQGEHYVLAPKTESKV